MKHAFSLILTLAALPAAAEPPVVEAAKITGSGGVFTVSATLSHPDTGWDHYADGWRVESPDGAVLGTRELLHPHETEQPFTRSLSGVAIPAQLTEVVLRARCNVTGWSAETLTVSVRD